MHFRSSIVMARPISARNFSRPEESRSINPSSVATVSGISYSTARVSGLSNEASLESTAFIR